MDAAVKAKPVVRQPREQSLTERQTRLAYILLIPTFIVLVVVAFYPLARTFLASFTDEPFAHPGVEVHNVGLNNYKQLLSVQFVELPAGKSPADVMPNGYREIARLNILGKQIMFVGTDRDFIRAIGNTLLFTVISVVMELILGLVVAMVVNAKFPGRGIMRAAMLVPWAIPTVVSARMWQWMLKDNSAGVINDILVNKLHLLPDSQAWLANGNLLIPSIVLIDVWKTVPFMALLLLAGLQIIPADVYEAAAVDGATGFEAFLTITLPLLRPTILVALIFRTLDALRAFDVFQVLLGRQLLSMATYNYEKLVGSQLYGYASAIGVLIFILLFVFTIIYMTGFQVETD